MRLPDISCREDESDLRGRYQPLAIGSSQLGRRKPQSLRLIAGSNHAGLVDVCPLDLLFFVGILQVGHSNAPANGVVPSRAILRRSLRCKGSDRVGYRDDDALGFWSNRMLGGMCSVPAFA
jgi:hypothetical protein